MSGIFIWNGVNPISIDESSSLPKCLKKICQIDQQLFLLSSTGSIYRADIHQDETPLVFEKLTSLKAVDISSYGEELAIVEPGGGIGFIDLQGMNKRNVKIKVKNKNRCLHQDKVSSIQAGPRGVLLITDYGHLLASGYFFHINIDSEDPSKVTFFENRPVYKAAIGEDFALVVTRKNIAESDETESDNDDDVFISACSRCRSNSRYSSPGSQTFGNETCPLGVNYNKSSEESTVSSARHLETATFTEGTSSSPENCELDQSHDEPKPTEQIELRTTEKKPENDTTTCDFAAPKIDERTSAIFINAEAAKQFLTKQLSWVSAGEDYLVECTEKPTRIIKENVSTLTNLVVEGVKTVGDKVVTLSRHMSGSSETNDTDKNEKTIVEELNPLYSLLSSCKLEDVQLSSSTVSEKDGTKQISEKINMITKLGQNVLNSEVWAWGEVDHGQLGTGDKVVRSQPVIISCLSNLGVHKISCGKYHSAALTLDGRVFTWGHNKWNQVSSDSNEDRSHPVNVIFENKTDRAKDIQCGDYHTLILTQNDNIYFAGKHKNGFTTFTIINDPSKTVKVSESGKNGIVKSSSHLRRLKKNLNFYSSLLDDIDVNNFLFASDNISVYQMSAPNLSVDPQALSVLQQYLEEILFVYQNFIKTLLKKTEMMTPHCELYESICNIYTDILYFTSANVMSFLKFYETHHKPTEIIMIQYSEEHITLYSKYLKLFCNIICIGYSQIISQMQISSNLKNFIKTKYNISNITSENIIYSCFMHLLDFANIGKCIFQSLISYNSKNNIPPDIKTTTDQKFNDASKKWDSFINTKEKSLKEAEATKAFWNGNNKLLDIFCVPNRRLIKESKNDPISLLHPGRFSSHHFILFTDIFLHVNGSTQNVYNLNTLWAEPLGDTDSVLNAILLTTPEETITLVTPSSQGKNSWFQAFQSTIKIALKKEQMYQPPLARSAAYTYTNKSQLYKDAKYTGKWMNGKLHGIGKIQWPDGKIYVGNFNNNQIHGNGRMQMPNIGTYEGQWKDNMQNGFGVMRYLSGDIFEGFFKDGLAHGHGVRKQGDFNSSLATIYMGDWVQGMRQGYGVMDDIAKGEKYLGYWNDNKKQGCGLIVTLDGIYYEGVFNNGDLTGQGVMVFEDGTHYEGEFRSVGVFNGKGVLTFSSGGKFEGNLSGAWTDGVKVSSGMLHLTSSTTDEDNSKPKSFGKLSVPPNQKWIGLFSHCYQQFGINNNNGLSNSAKKGNQKPMTLSPTDNKKIWQNIAVILFNSQKDASDNAAFEFEASKKSFALTTSSSSTENLLDVIPLFGQTSLTKDSYEEVFKYLNKACESAVHPLGQLISGCAAAFTASYGGVRVHPLLLSHAVVEFLNLSSRVYTIFRLLFPALPPPGEHIIFNESDNDFNEDIVSDLVVVQSILLPRIHPTLHVLYALHHQKEDSAYWKRLLNWNRQTDITLMAFLGVDQKFWLKYTQQTSSESGVVHSPIKDQIFFSAVETLQQLKTTFSPMEKMFVIRDTFKDITSAIQKELGPSYMWTMDELFPVFHVVVVRARILQLGSEIQFIEDFLDPCVQNGELDIMFTTLKACYHQILQEKVTIYE